MANKKSPPTSVSPVKRLRRPLRREGLSKEDIVDLKILLETEKDIGSFLAKI
jgi:hypothetical protein